MSRRRFYAPPESFAHGAGAVALPVEESRHLREVLRLRAGEEAFVFDGEGREFRCVVEEAGRRGSDAARLGVLEQVEPPSAESPLELALAVALLKGEKFDLVVQKATELGVWRVVPVVTRRADVRLRDERDAARRVERWRRLALEACKQSGRARVPAVAEPVEFSALVATVNAEDASARLMFAERGGAALDEVAAGWDVRPASVFALVGPEGGWDEEETSQAAREGWTLVTLGGRVLRAETTALVAAALLQHLCGDMK